MNQTITLTPEQIEEFNAGKPVTITLQKPVEQWEPKGGAWYIDGGGKVLQGNAGGTGHQNFGTEYPTKELAEKARDAMRIHNRLLAYVLEHALDWEADWDDDEDNYLVYFNSREKIWDYIGLSCMNYPGAIYMPEQVAKELCEKLNNGIVKL